jgi:nitroreductase
MEKTIYEIKYNDWFTLQMESEREPMEEIEFDKAALEAVLADIVLRAKHRSGSREETEALWRWVCEQIGHALQNTELAPDAAKEPLDTVLGVVSRLRGGTA